MIERAAREDPDALLVIASDTHAGITRVGDLPTRTARRCRRVRGDRRGQGRRRRDAAPELADDARGVPRRGRGRRRARADRAHVRTGRDRLHPRAVGRVGPGVSRPLGEHRLPRPPRRDAVGRARHGRDGGRRRARRARSRGPTSWPRLAPAHQAGSSPSTLDPDDPLLVVYTSGTTADPKGVLHSHETFVGRALPHDPGPGRSDATGWWCSPGPQDTWRGSCAILSPALTRATTVLVDRWDVDLVCELHRALPPARARRARRSTSASCSRARKPAHST